MCDSCRDHPELSCWPQWEWWQQVTGKSRPRGVGIERRGWGGRTWLEGKIFSSGRLESWALRLDVGNGQLLQHHIKLPAGIFLLLFLHPSAVTFSFCHWSLSTSLPLCCHSGQWPLSPVPFELLTPQLRGVNGYCWVDTAQIRLHIAHILEVRPFKGITLRDPSAPTPCTCTHKVKCMHITVCHYKLQIFEKRDKQTSSYVFLPVFLYCRAAGLLWCSRPLSWLTSLQAASISSGFPKQWLTPVLINASADSDTSLEPCSCHVKEASTLRCSW